MLTKSAAIALGVIVTILAGILIVVLIPSILRHPSASLNDLWYWAPTLAYAAATVVGGAAAGLVVIAPSIGTAVIIGVFGPMMMVLGAGGDISSEGGLRLAQAILGAAGAYLGQVFVPQIRLSRTRRPSKDTPRQNVSGRTSMLRAVTAFLVAFLVTFFVFLILLAPVKDEPSGSTVALACLFIFCGSVLGNVASELICQPSWETLPLWTGLAVPAYLYLLGIVAVFGIDLPYDTRFSADVSQALYLASSLFVLKWMTPFQNSLLMIFGIAGAYSGRALSSSRGLLKHFVWVVPCVNCLGALAIIVGIATLFLSDGVDGATLLGAGVVTGLVGSMPTLILARIMDNKAVFRLATLSLSVSFGAILFLVVGVILMPRTDGGGNESAAVASVRTVTTAEITYQSSAGHYTTVPELIRAGLLDTGFNGTKSGYNYSISTNGVDYTITAYPASQSNGRYGFYSVSDGVVRYSTQTTLAPAKMAGNPVG